MMRRRRRSAARWSFADSETLSYSGASPSPIASMWLLPPARVNYLMSTQGRRNSLVFSGCHLWLDFWWKSTGSQTGLPDVNLGIVKSTIADPTSFAPDLSLAQAQWDQPSTPATITSWDEDDDSGVDSWLWQHWIKGMSPPNATVSTFGANGSAANQVIFASTGTVDAPVFVCRKFFVTQEWQPDVVVRSKRRLQKDEGILLYMTSDTLANTLSCNLNVHVRVLTK